MRAEKLREATGCTEALAVAYAQPLSVAMNRWGVICVPEFLAQLAVESGKFSRLQEDLTYKTPERLMAIWPSRFPDRRTALNYINQPKKLAELVYGKRLGNILPSDGWNYRGRGLIQLTGKANYAKYQEDSRISCVSDPDKLLDPMVAADCAAWFWTKHDCDAVAEDIEAVTRRINGGLHGLQERIVQTRIARTAFAG